MATFSPCGFFSSGARLCCRHPQPRWWSCSWPRRERGCVRPPGSLRSQPRQLRRSSRGRTVLRFRNLPSLRARACGRPSVAAASARLQDAPSGERGGFASASSRAAAKTLLNHRTSDNSTKFGSANWPELDPNVHGVCNETIRHDCADFVPACRSGIRPGGGS